VSRRLYFCFFSLLLCLSSCTPIKPNITNQYTLTLAQPKAHHQARLPYALLISKPEAMAGYRTEQMLYVSQRFSLTPFAKNAWSNPPADMLYPLLVQRFQDSHAFRAISSSPYADKADYRLDTQLIALHQNFLSKKSTLQLIAKITFTRISDNRILASRLIEENIPCPSNTPYGGVIAANQAASVFALKTLDFVIKSVHADKGSQKI
jgi:cholesterol transport system auxiliary component